MQYLNAVRPLLLTWAERYNHLREITTEDVLAALEPLHGNKRRTVLVALRSLFAAAKKNGAVFGNPTSRIRVGGRADGVLQPLTTDHVDRTITAAVRPADPLILALAAIHAARAGGIRDLLLDDVDLGNRRLTIAGRTRPLDEMTRRALLHWLDRRRTRWPTTANAGDAAGIAALYEEQAVMAYPPGAQTVGREAIRELWEKVLANVPRFELEDPLPTLVSGDIALTSTPARDGTGVRAQVVRRQPDGSWLRLLDQPESHPAR